MKGDRLSLPPVTFGFGETDVGVSSDDANDTGSPAVGAFSNVPQDGAAPWQLGQRSTTLADVDGDGLADLLRVEAGNHAWRKNLGGRFGPPAPIREANGDMSTLGGEACGLVDTDGNTHPALATVINETWRVRALDVTPDGVSWAPPQQIAGTEGLLPLGFQWELALGRTTLDKGTLASHPPPAITDINGDGRMDVIRTTGDRTTVFLGGPNGFGPPLRRPAIDINNPDVFPGAEGLSFVDANGDGLADVVDLNQNWMRLYLGRGDGYFDRVGLVRYPWGPDDPLIRLDEIRLGDMDRDGILDLVRVTIGRVRYYPGRWTAQARGNSGTGVAPAGVNNADDPSALMFADMAVEVGRPPDVSYDALVTLADVNGNGSKDVVWSTQGGMWMVDVAGVTTAGMVTSIDNGLGMTTRITYPGLGRAGSGSAGDRRAVGPAPAHGGAGAGSRADDIGIRRARPGDDL